jgi:hypothetical protein
MCCRVSLPPDIHRLHVSYRLHISYWLQIVELEARIKDMGVAQQQHVRDATRLVSANDLDALLDNTKHKLSKVNTHRNRQLCGC